MVVHGLQYLQANLSHYVEKSELGGKDGRQ